MAGNKQFRSSIHGFNREDVVQYIEYLTSKNNIAVNQLKSENQTLLFYSTDYKNVTKNTDIFTFAFSTLIFIISPSIIAMTDFKCPVIFVNLCTVKLIRPM